jgi:cytochrome c oxidase subunit 3
VNLIVASAGVLIGLLVWWLAVSRLTTKSWEAQGTTDGRGTAEMLGVAPERVGLWVLLAVITSFFALFITAYAMRMTPHPVRGISLADWQPLPEPWILWVNTVLLLLGSTFMQVARVGASRGKATLARVGLLAGGAFAFAFLAGQWLAWRQLQAEGYYAAANPANAFFYVLTGLHGLHLLGGLCVWGWTLARMSRDDAIRDGVRLSVELCTVYWHYLLVVWLVLFGLLLIT